MLQQNNWVPTRRRKQSRDNKKKKEEDEEEGGSIHSSIHTCKQTRKPKGTFVNNRIE